MKNTKKIELLILLASLILIIIILIKSDLKGLIPILLNANVLVLTIAFLLVILTDLICFARFYIFLRYLGCKTIFFRIAFFSASAMLFNYASPGKVGIPAKAGFLKEIEKIPVKNSLSAATMEIFMDIAFHAIVIFSLFFLLPLKIGILGFFNLDIKQGVLLIMLLIISIVILSTLFLRFTRKWTKEYLYLLKQLFHKSNLAIGFLLTIMMWMLIMIVFYLIFSALNQNINFLSSTFLMRGAQFSLF